MKVNEKIQHYRKIAGLSQEELGKKLLVSRQTVSLWETGQTLPTLDNLVRLREIFGVSIDELLSEEGEVSEPLAEEEAPKPEECYTFSYSKEEFKKIFRKVIIPSLSLAIFFLVALVVGVLAALSEPFPGFEQGAQIVGSFIFTVAFFLIVFNFRRNMRKSEGKSLATEYTLRVFSDHFVFEKREDGILYELRTVAFGDIKSINENKDFVTVTAEGVIYHFKRSSIDPNSALFELIKQRKSPQNRARKAKKTALVIVVAIAAIAVITFAVIFVLSLTKYHPIEDAEYYLALDLPEKASGVSMNVVEEYYGDTYLYYHAEYFYEDEEANALEAAMESDSRWLTRDGAKRILALYPEPEGIQGADRYIFVDLATDALNTVPRDDSYAWYLLAAYYEDENLLVITEFDTNN